MKRKTPKTMWLVFYHGPRSSNITMDLQAAWRTKTAALLAIARARESGKYTAVKYCLEDTKGAK